MDMQPVAPTRIVILARPELARQVEVLLRGWGHEVYRTPDASGVASLVSRIRPHLVIIAQDIPWADATETPQSLASRLRHVPVLLIGEVNSDGHANGIPHLPPPLDQVALQESVTRLLGSSQANHRFEEPPESIHRHAPDDSFQTAGNNADVSIAPAPLGEQMNRRHVLIINRDAPLFAESRALLHAQRYNVTTTSLVPATIAMIGALLPDVIVVDLALEEPELRRLVEHLETVPWLRKIPVILTAADPTFLGRAQMIEDHSRGRFVFLQLLRPADMVDCVQSLIGPA